MATVDYSPLFNSLRNAGTNMANMALKGIEAEGQAAKAALWRDQTLANTALPNSKTRIYDQKYETLSDIINRVKAAHGGDDPYSVDEQNRLVSAVGTHNYFPNQPIGNTGYVVNKASGEVSGGNPLAENYSQFMKGKTAAQVALAAARSQGKTGVSSGGSGSVQGATPEGVGLAVVNQLAPLFKKYETVRDQYGMERQVERVDIPALLKFVVETTLKGGNPRDLMTAARYMYPEYFQGEGAQQPQASAPVQETPAAETVAPTDQPVVPQTTPQDLSQVELDTQDKILNLVRIGKMPYEEALRIAEVNGWE